MSHAIVPREAAYLAVWSFLKEGRFIRESLDKWQKEHNPSRQDFNLALDIAAGAVRMALALDFIGKKLANRASLSLKVKEKALLRTTLYQAAFRPDIPLYALGQEAGNLAKKYCHPVFAKFLNALVRKLNEGVPTLPQEKTLEALSVRYSIPIFLVELFVNEFGMVKSQEWFELANVPPKVTVRLRGGSTEGMRIIPQVSSEMQQLEDTSMLPAISQSPLHYIQNPTPFLLMQHLLAQKLGTPEHILDLCAAPGGKLLLAHDFFPTAQLFANDISEAKLSKLKENSLKYGLKVTLSCSKGEDFASPHLFDLIILDVPCSNTGVLNKRPEARWRLSEESLQALEETQLKLLKHATRLLGPGGQIWYLTCSILERENAQIVEKACKNWNLHMATSFTLYPTETGLDGGFACLLQKK